MIVKKNNLEIHLRPLVSSIALPQSRNGRPPIGAAAMSNAERQKRKREKQKPARKIGVIDFETDPFDNKTQELIYPFTACVHSAEFDHVIWEENFSVFKAKLRTVFKEILRNDGPHIFYAHNGGKFDFLFLISELRGEVSFKGRGIMCAEFEGHELRDSFHIIPEALANFQKEKFDYTKLKRERRKGFKTEIISYMQSDCRYLLQIVQGFIDEFGIKISIGQAAMHRLKSHYEIKRLDWSTDEFLRTWFYGGRVECVKGAGDFKGAFRLYDVNSMYPDVMANLRHPVGGPDNYKYRVGDIGPETIFIDLHCENRGAFVGRAENGETTARVHKGRFYTTIWEYKVAELHGLISNVKVNYCVDCSVRTDFAKHILPIYERRMKTKAALASMKANGLEGTPQFLDMKKDDMFLKFLLNTGYGKFAQNPRTHKQFYLTDPGEEPPAEWLQSIERAPASDQDYYKLPIYENDAYWIWCKPAPTMNFNNVGTAASITGAARAKLLDALCRAKDPIYCDTDSIICRELPGVEIHKEKLGAWDIEDEFKRVTIIGKKLYSTESVTAKKGADGQITPYRIKSKGVAGLQFADMFRLLEGAEIPVTSKGPSLDKFGGQKYLTRKVRRTAEFQT